MHYNKVWFEIAMRCALTLCLAVALCVDMGIPGAFDSQIIEQAGTVVAPERVEPVWHAVGLRARGSLVTPLFSLLLWANWKLDRKKPERRISFLIASAFIGLIWLMAEGFRVDNTLWTLHASYIQILKSLIYFVGVTYGLYQITCFLYGALEERGAKNVGEGALTDQRRWRSRIVNAYREHTALVSFGTIFALWLPHLILAYPANICKDAYAQLAQALGLIGYSNHHPIVSTLLMGMLIKAGSLISGNFGLFLCITAQAVSGAWVLAYTLSLMRELNTPVWLRTLTFGCYISIPYYTNYIGLIIKDVFYSYAALLFVTELIYFLVQREAFFRSRKHIVLLAVSIAGSILLRNNGRYMIYPATAAVIFYLFFCRRKSAPGSKERKSVLYPAMAAFLIPVLLAELFLASLMSFLDAKPGSVAEALSLPLQQTARYVKEFGDEVTEEEKAAISAVLKYEALAEMYDPLISDPIKRQFNSSATTGEIKDYLLVWLKQFTKHPFVYIKATVNQNYSLLYPFIPNNLIYVNRISDEIGSVYQEDVVEILGLHDVKAIADFEHLLEAFYTMCFFFPGLNALSHPAFYMMMLTWLTLFSLHKKRFLWLLAAAPLWLSAAIGVLSPVIMGSPRYVFPVIYAMPSLLAYYIYLGRAGETHNKTAATADCPSA